MALKRKILVVDDEAHIVELLVMNLKQHGYETCSASDGPSALARTASERPDLILLDLMLPGISGLEVCRALRQDRVTAAIPIIMLTAKSEETDKVIGLGIGADDYVTKPFGLRELVARIEVALRRANQAASILGAGPMRVGNLEIDDEGHSAAVAGQPVSLSPAEFLILSALAAASGKIVRRSDLVERAGLNAAPEGGRSLDVHIRNLRKKLAVPASADLRIETVRGIGYRLHG